MDVIYGATGGLGTGKAALHLEQGTGTEAVLASASDSGDRTGATFYLRGSVNRTLLQGSSGVAGTLEAGDKFGSSVVASPGYVVVGIPGESVASSSGADVVSGQVDVMTHELNGSGGRHVRPRRHVRRRPWPLLRR